MIIVDTSVWIEVLRDRTGEIVKSFRERLSGEICVLTRFTQLELLQGARDEYEWQKLEGYLATQFYVEATDTTWEDAARIYFDLRRTGITINSPIDCCIAQIAIENHSLLLHKDNDFEIIAKIRPLNAILFN
jgi:predicted nucleic acid-binding protein